MKKAAQLILVEGGDGSGKSTLVRSLAEQLKAQGQEVVMTREPGGSEKAEEVRRMILQREVGDNFAPDAEILLFYAARLQHLDDTIVPALTAGKVVICDRFEVSTYAYQIHARAGNRPLFDFLHGQVVARLQSLGVPCTYVHCEVDVAVARARIQASGRVLPDVFDAREAAFHEAVAAGYQAAKTALHPLFQHVVVDANQPADAVLTEARDVLGL